MAENHVRAWLACGAEVRAVVDTDEQRCSDLAGRWNIIQRYSDYETAIRSEPHTDVVDVCVPLRWHAPVTICAAEHGKNILCEKPIARDVSEVEQMEAAIVRSGVKFALGQQRNLSPGVRLLQNWVQQGVFGRPLMFQSDIVAEVRPKRFMHDADNNNGPIVDTCVHNFLLWETVLRAKPVQIYAQGGVLAHARPEVAHFERLAVDTAALVVTYGSGDIAAMNVSWGMPAQTRLQPRTDRLLGPLACVDADTALDFMPAQTGAHTAFRLYRGDADEVVQLGEADTFVLQAAAFIDYLDGGRAEPPAGLRTGRHLLHMSLAALESIRTGQAITL